MKDIAFKCQECGQHFSAPGEMAGHPITCPNCKAPLEVPSAHPPIQTNTLEVPSFTPSRGRDPITPLRQSKPQTTEAAYSTPKIQTPKSWKNPLTISLSIIFICILIIACFSIYPISGTVFVTTMGGDTKKLSLVPVFIISKSKFIECANRVIESKTPTQLNDFMADIASKSSAKTKTNADGNFSISSVCNEKIIVAVAERYVRYNQLYIWILPVSKTTKKINLDNDNMLKSTLDIEEYSKVYPDEMKKLVNSL